MSNENQANGPQPAYPQPAQPMDYAPMNLSPDTERIRKVALYQRCVIYCLLAEILAFVLIFTLGIERIAPPAALGQIVFPAAFWAIRIAAAFFVFMLAIEVYSLAAGIVLGGLALLPIVGVIILLIINQKATSLLRKVGIPVGLLGANSKHIPDR